MTSYRITIRFGAPRSRYHVEDVEAESLMAALSQLAEDLPAEVRGSADLLEARAQPDPEQRSYTPG